MGLKKNTNKDGGSARQKPAQKIDADLMRIPCKRQIRIKIRIIGTEG